MTLQCPFPGWRFVARNNGQDGIVLSVYISSIDFSINFLWSRCGVDASYSWSRLVEGGRLSRLPDGPSSGPVAAYMLSEGPLNFLGIYSPSCPSEEDMTRWLDSALGDLSMLAVSLAVMES